MAKFNLKREIDITKAIKYYLDILGVKKSCVAAKYHVLYH